MSFIMQPDLSKWDCTTITDPAIVTNLADTAVAHLRELDTDAQQSILAAIKDLPPTQIDLEDIAHCALGQDERAEETGEIDEAVIDAAQAILSRADVAPLIDIAAVMTLISAASTDYSVMRHGVNLLAAMPVERIPFQEIVDLGIEYADDEDFGDAVFALLEQHQRVDDMQQLYEDDDDEDTYLGGLCREAVDEEASPVEVQAVAQPS